MRLTLLLGILALAGCYFKHHKSASPEVRAEFRRRELEALFSSPAGFRVVCDAPTDRSPRPNPEPHEWTPCIFEDKDLRTQYADLTEAVRRALVLRSADGARTIDLLVWNPAFQDRTRILTDRPPPEEGVRLFEMPGPGGPISVRPGGRTVLFRVRERHPVARRAEDADLLVELEPATRRLRTLAAIHAGIRSWSASPSGARILLEPADGTGRLVLVEGEPPRARVLEGAAYGGRGISWGPGERQAAFVDLHGMLGVLAIEGDAGWRSIGDAMGPVAWSPDGSLLAFQDVWNRDIVACFEPGSGKRIEGVLRARREGRVSDLRWSSDGRFLYGAVSGEDKPVPFRVDFQGAEVRLDAARPIPESPCLRLSDEEEAAIRATEGPRAPTTSAAPPSEVSEPEVEDPELEPIRRNAEGYCEFRHRATGIVLIYVPPGEFPMGCEDGRLDEAPSHRVQLDGYYIGKYEVRRSEYRGWPGASGRMHVDPHGPPVTDDCPATLVSWHQSKSFCEWAGLRLPTEAEWERAARGTDGRRWPWGNERPGATGCNHADRRLWTRLGTSGGVFTAPDRSWADSTVDDGFEELAPVGSYPSGKSPIGAHDMAGNVWEWCEDAYVPDFYASCPDGTAGPCAQAAPGASWRRVVRGGSWNDDADGVRSSLRHRRRTHPDPSSWEATYLHTGFRVARDATPARPR